MLSQIKIFMVGFGGGVSVVGGTEGAGSKYKPASIREAGLVLKI